jgi:hypothetical protein
MHTIEEASGVATPNLERDGATERATSRVSSALQTLGRCTLPLSTMRSALS